MPELCDKQKRKHRGREGERKGRRYEKEAEKQDERRESQKQTPFITFSFQELYLPVLPLQKQIVWPQTANSLRSLLRSSTGLDSAVLEAKPVLFGWTCWKSLLPRDYLESLSLVQKVWYATRSETRMLLSTCSSLDAFCSDIPTLFPHFAHFLETELYSSAS